MKLIQNGTRDAKILVVGSAPGGEEVKDGKAFSGYSGQLLNQMLDRAGIKPYECFFTNVVHVPPAGQKAVNTGVSAHQNFHQLMKSNPNQYLFGVLQLKEDIETIKPNLVLALGHNALRALTGKRSIVDWRGSLLDSPLVAGTKVLATYSPADIALTWDYKAVADMDLAKAFRESAYPDIRRMRRDLILDPDSNTRAGLVEELLRAEWLAVDIECFLDAETGLWKLACIGFADRADRGVCIPYNKHDTIIDAEYRRLLESPVKKVLQNGTFDVTVLRENGFDVKNFAWDTMLAHHALYPESSSGGDEMSALGGKKRQAALSKGLAFLTSIYTDIPRYKDDGKLWKEQGDISVFWRYNALDCVATWEVRDGQEKDLTDFGTVPVLEHSMSMVEPLMSMTRKGIRVDTTLRAQMKAEYEAQIANLQAFLDLGAGRPVNVSSSKDIPWLLYEHLKLPEQMKVRKKSDGSRKTTVSADRDSINKLASKHKNPLLMTIIKIREKRTVIERYLDTPLDSDGYLRCAWDITGTRSGRLSSRASLSGSGTNLQNQPEEVRVFYIPDDGKVFVYRDYSQAEARVVAYLSGDRYLMDLFNDPTRDIHKETASRIFSVDLSIVTDAQRYLGKKVRHAVNYGMEASRFVEVVNDDAETTGLYIDQKMAQKVIDGFFMLHPNHKPVYWGNVEKALKYTRTLNTPFGRKRTFFGRMDNNLIKEAYSYIPQSTIGDLCERALVRCYNEIELARPDLGVNVLLNVHDSILVQCNIGAEHEVADMMKACMDIPITMGSNTFRIPTDCKVGLNWANKGKDGSNPRGLVDISKWKGLP
ncbi:PolA DNA polymerase I - 3'-5' exonuclease and polymerase domains [uncultured Caudovirales phage]|uniref:PolA DNA polymerase I - 3'-5' exonuclease and polymerase domains n=2 Tax=root TaxID=1 RepID=A0A6J5SRK8_9CAUD|nr:PolA DNA polymerase I - 3'-5' exonuclease and polymerase domains [uncultured Caudovirales phage]CAB4171279.1 PolA DNA polymerase I - 3'-5' exonuclease and polymerase domains [uncultured Caudovirales phage]CAB4177234.1 PolA DNA polymerase I - 3'-5' exonuclease and polymerase domains [uncultured Caudovirales phage]CAB4182917.1 PolA DNA polymerase I - 3'-5' exonuclease and polymerase domains [uncultured Caudovirales phage]CAB4187554.1 PolA DNA polymerase I - 3'-5' exonuclease and polymerase dom